MELTNIAEIKHHGFKKSFSLFASFELIIKRSAVKNENDNIYYSGEKIEGYYIKYNGFDAEPVGDLKIKLLDGTVITIFSTEKIENGMLKIREVKGKGAFRAMVPKS